MKLNQKTLVFLVALMALLVLVLTALSAYNVRRFSLYTAERHARSVAETVKVGLTESMINGTIDRRAQFLARLADVPGVQAVRVVRGDSVIKQYGPGMTQESGSGEALDRVFQTAKESFSVRETDAGPLFEAVIPYTATDHGVPNCMQCHSVNTGAVLGAVMIEISLADVRRQGIIAVLLVSFTVLVAAIMALAFLRRMLRPLAATAAEVKDVTTVALGGDFQKRVYQHSADEIGDIATNINRLMDFLEREVGTIRTRVGELMGHHTAGGNQLVHTAEMVDGLVEAAKFKQAVEEDQNKLEIYQRLAHVLERKYDFRQYSIYEIAASKNRISPIIVDGETGANCRWCDPQILVDSGSCRVRRTGHEVNSIDMPDICTMFRPSEEGDSHICLPINQSGTVGAVIQIVASKEEAPLAKCLVPFIAVYLREAGPVLESKRLMEHLRENSMRDAMTGLYNRRFLEEYVGQLVSTSQRRKSAFAVLMLDLDFFKQVNDTYGHEAGDKVIKALADILVRNVRSSDMAVRYGGEEFLLVLMDTGADGALKVAEKIREQVEATKVALPGAVLQKTISIGVAEFPEDADTFWQVVKFADVALYKAKSGGRNRVVRFLPEMWEEGGDY